MSSNTPADPLLGRTLRGRYRLERLLGQGGAGAVYEAQQLDLERKVAIKTLRPELATDAGLLERFRREARAAASLGHPHIALVLDWGDPSPHEPAFIAFEILRGESLLELLRREKRLAPERAARLMAQILSALETAHRAGIVHRDLKPGNVMVTPIPGLGESVKLLDFGIAQIKAGPAYQRLTQTGMILGTPRYMAPEQLRGGGTDARTDIWAAGIVLYRMLAGAMPFDGPPNEVMLAVLGAEPAPLAQELGVSVPLQAVVLRALAKSPQARWPSAAAMYEALEAAMRAPAPRIAKTNEMPAMVPVVHSSEPLPGERTSLAVALGSPSAPALAPASPTAPRALVPLLLTLTAAGGCVLFATLAAGLAWMGDFGSAFSGAPAQGTPLAESSPSAAPVWAPEPDLGGLPPRGTLDTYVVLAEEIIHTEDPRATLDAIYVNGVDEDGILDLTPPNSALFVFRLADGGCQQVLFPPGLEEPSTPTCMSRVVIEHPPLDGLIRQARAACPALAAAPPPFAVFLTPYLDGESVTVVARSGPSVNAYLMPSAVLGPLPYGGLVCR